MGIRFLCPHCEHRLNIKVAQAGMRGDCPHCLLLIIVPYESNITALSSKKSLELASDGASTAAAANTNSNSASGSIFDVDNQITEAGLSASFLHEADSEFGSFTAPYISVPGKSKRSTEVSPNAPTHGEPFLLEKPAPPASLGKIDPIAEAPRKVWYFRSRELGEKGPLKARQMQEHFDCGDVTVGCIVWREDWEDWQPAEKVFPALVAIAGNRQQLDRFNPHSEFQRRQRQKQTWSLLAISAGLLIIVGLLYLVVQLLTG